MNIIFALSLLGSLFLKEIGCFANDRENLNVVRAWTYHTTMDYLFPFLQLWITYIARKMVEKK